MPRDPLHTVCASWEDALDEADLWGHACDLARTPDGWTLTHLDDPNALEVTEYAVCEYA